MDTMKYSKIFNQLAVQIFIIGFIGIAGTFLSDYLIKNNFFGDTSTTHDYGYGLRTCYEWGVRHYWYNWIVSILFILQVIRTIVSTVEEVEKLNQQK